MGKKLGGALFSAVIATGLAIATGGASIAATSGFLGLQAGTVGAFFARQFVQMAVLGFISQALAPKAASAGALSGTTVSSRSPIASRKIIYGRTRIGGTITFIEATGNANAYLWQHICLASHEIEAIESVQFGDVVVATNLVDGVETGATGQYASYANVTGHFGTASQVADATFVSETSITSDHRLQGIAYLATKMAWNEDKYPTGAPNVSAIVQGRKVYDPRSASTAYSNNAALCLLDYLMDDTFGLSASLAEIDTASFITAANICDELVSVTGGSTEKRYTINGMIDTARRPADILQEMAAAMAGTVYYSNGKWHVKAGAYITPVHTLTVDDFTGSIDITTRVTNQSNFNAVKGMFISPDDNWQPVDYVPITSATFEFEDNNERRYADMSLPLTTSSATAQRIAKISLYRNREQLTVTVPCKLTAFRFDIGDTLMLTHERMGWANKVFEVINWQFNAGEVPEVLLTLKETSSAVYDWNLVDEGILSRNNSTLPDAFTVAPVTNFDVSQLTSILDDGAYQSSIIATWDAPASGFVTHYEVQWKRAAADTEYGSVTEAATVVKDYGLITAAFDEALDWGLVSEEITQAESYWNSILTTDQQFVINNVLVTNYTVRVRAVNSFGVRSAWVIGGLATLADTTPPAAPENMLARGGFRQIEVTWSNPADADFDMVQLYRNTTNNSAGAAYVGSTRGTTYTDTGLGINETFYYWTKASDRTGNDSGFSSGVSATTAFVDSADFSAEVLNLFAEAGAYGIEPVASLPVSGDFDGQIKYDTTANKLYRWDATGAAWTDDIFSITAGSVDLASFAAGIEPVSIVAALPNPVGYTGAQVVFLTTDYKLYRYDSVTPAWTSATAATDISGTIGATNFPSDLRPVEIVNSLPVADLFDGRQVYLTTDKKLYRYNGTAWITSIASTDISGTITDAQIAGLAASKLSGTITETQIANDAITTPKLAAGAVTSAEIAAGTIQASNIAAGSITSAQIAAGTITASNMAANTLTAGTIAAGAIGADEIAASAVTADKLSANSVIAGKIAAGAVSADAIAANVITGDKIAAGTIQGDKIAANTITGGLLATAGVITTAAQIENAVITNAKIANAAVDTLKVAGNAITVPVASSVQPNATFTYSHTIYVNIPVGSVVYASGTISQAYVGGSPPAWQLTLRINGSIVFDTGTVGGGQFQQTASASGGIYCNAGVIPVTLQWTGSVAYQTLGWSSLYAVGAMR